LWILQRARALLTPGARDSAKQRARRTGIRGETYAYWYLRRHGYVLVARNYRSPGIKGEIDMIGYDGPVLAFVEAKTRQPKREIQTSLKRAPKTRSTGRSPGI